MFWNDPVRTANHPSPVQRVLCKLLTHLTVKNFLIFIRIRSRYNPREARDRHPQFLLGLTNGNIFNSEKRVRGVRAGEAGREVKNMRPQRKMLPMN